MRFAIFAILACLGTSALAQEGMPAPITKSAEHEHLKGMAGKWKVESTMFQPDGKTEKSEGTQVAELTLDGLGLTYDHKGKMGPMDFIGHGFMTWIPGKKQYQTVWMDNMSHMGMSTGWGSYDAATKSFTEVMTGPGPDGKDMTMTLVTKMDSADKHTVAFMMKGPDGKEFKMMEMVYTRIKG